MRRSVFEQIYEEQFDGIYRYALAQMGNPASAEELTQEAFLRLFENGARVRNPKAWLFRVANNLRTDWFREQGKQHSSRRCETAIVDPETALQEQELVKRVVSAIAALSVSQRECIILRQYGEMSYREIADLLDMSIDEVKVHLYRARRNLRQRLERLE